MALIIQKTLEVYRTRNGEVPFIFWLEAFRDRTIRSRIKERLDRLSLGNFGDYKTIDKGIAELRLNFGSGYRIYYGYVNEDIILLLCAGDKSTQTKDIKRAKRYWKNYLIR